MRILVTGVSGFIGSHLTQTLIDMGYAVSACVRNCTVPRQRWPGITVLTADFSKDHETADWLPRLKDIDVVINTVGIIRENGAQTFDALHAKAPIALFRACEIAGIKRVIQISALGADDTAFSQYHLSKRQADRVLMKLNLHWAVVMPSIVYGPGAKSMAFFKAWAALPIIPLVDAGDQPVQPIYIDDLVQAVLQLIQPQAPKQLRIELVGPYALTMATIYTQLHQWLGLGNTRFISLPYGMCLFAARLWGLSGNTPLTGETVKMLRKGNTGDLQPFVAQFGFTPRSFENVLQQTPAQQSDRWHAGLYFLNPLLRISLAILWIFTGIVSAFLFPTQQSYTMLSAAGITGLWAPVMLYSAATTDIVFGLAVLSGYRLRIIGSIQIAVIVLYTVIISFSLPEQWLHPFGPISKNLPLVVATMIMIVMSKR